MNLSSKNFLIIESSFAKSKAGLYQNGKLTSKEGLENQKNSQYLLEIIDQLLKESTGLSDKKTKKNISAIALSSGPGSFTAMRVGVSIAKALSYSFAIPIIPICSLQATCQTAMPLIEQNIANWLKPKLKTNSSNPTIKITALMDARVKGIYQRSFELKKNQLLAIDQTKLINVADLKDSINHLITANPSDSTASLHFLAGNFLTIYEDEMNQKLKDKISKHFQAIVPINAPSIESMVDLALQSKKKDWQNAISFEINYVRNQVADQPSKQ